MQNPLSGTWQLAIQTSSATELAVFANVRSNLRLLVTTDSYTYRPGSTVTLAAALAEGANRLPVSVISGTVTHPDNSSTLLNFYDDGTHGDTVANDHLYTAQFVAPTLTGYPLIRLSAMSGAVTRIAETEIAVAPQTATFQQIVAETPVDANANGYYDSLDIDIALTVLTAGEYNIVSSLVSATGEHLLSDAYSTKLAAAPLATGVQTVRLSFNGKTLRQLGVNGPYKLTKLYIEYDHPTEYGLFVVDAADNVYTTAAYTVNQFEGESISVIGGNEGVTDLNGDGLYDSLTISVTLDTLLPGEYSWSGTLVDATGAHVTGAAGEGQLNNQKPAVFTFGGRQLLAAGLNGPYRLTDVYITKTSGKVFTEYFDDLHITAPYQVNQFGSLPLLLTNLQQQTFDGNGNGLADALIVTSTITALGYEGEYIWRGRLVAANGVQVAAASGGGPLFEGKKLAFVFLSPTIRNAGLNGPYTIRDVTLTSTAMPTITMAYPLLGVTSAYPASQFDDWQSSITAHTITPVDVDGNNLYDRLEFSTTVALPWPALYEISFALTTQDGSMGPTITNMKNYLGSTPELLQFTGSAIVNAGLDGPYLLKLTDLLYLPLAGQATPLNITHTITTTPPYQVSQFQGFPILPPPAAPVLSQPVNDDNDGNYTVEWSPITGTVSYELQERRGSLLVNPYITIYTGTVPSFIVTERQPRVYYYRVRTKRGLQSSGWSSSVAPRSQVYLPLINR